MKPRFKEHYDAVVKAKLKEEYGYANDLEVPRIDKIVVKRSSVVRRAKLYFLRDRVGKAVRLKERRRS